MSGLLSLGVSTPSRSTRWCCACCVCIGRHNFFPIFASHRRYDRLIRSWRENIFTRYRRTSRYRWENFTFISLAYWRKNTTFRRDSVVWNRWIDLACRRKYTTGYRICSVWRNELISSKARTRWFSETVSYRINGVWSVLGLFYRRSGFGGVLFSHLPFEAPVQTSCHCIDALPFWWHSVHHVLYRNRISFSQYNVYHTRN